MSFIDSEHRVTEPTEAPHTREQEVLDVITRIEVPFMVALQREYGDKRGWRICGPASIALSRILSSLTKVPIQKGGDIEHIELEVGIYDPKNDPDRTAKVEEQTYVRYYTGTGDVYYIDPIFGLLMEEREEIEGAIQVEKYGAAEIDRALIEKHDLYPFNPEHDGIEFGGLFTGMTPGQSSVEYLDVTNSLNDDRATMDHFLRDSGTVWEGNWGRTVGIIKEFAPEWTIDEGILTRRQAQLQTAQLSYALQGQFSMGGVDDWI